jgi:hemolysin activation/secretion protein
MNRASIVVRSVLLATVCALGHAAESPPPGAGTILQELKPLAPPTPSPAEPGLTIEQQTPTDLPVSAPFPVKEIRIVGNTSFATSVLHALLADSEGGQLTLPELHVRVARISDFYHAHGYPLARAVIPAQTIREGVVEVQVIEARYGQVRLDNRSTVSSSLLQATLAPVQSGQLIDQSTLDRVLLLLGDIPGVSQSATLQPGDLAGTSNLLIQAEPGPAAGGLLTVDNEGNRYTGRVRGTGELALYDLLHHGDILDASILTSGKGLNYGRLSYALLLSGAGTRLGGAYSVLRYTLDESLVDLQGNGTAQVASLWLRQPLLRTRELNVYAQIQFDHKDLHDNIDVGEIHTDRHLDIGSVGLSGDWRDGWLSGGTNSWSAQWVGGRVEFDDADAQRVDEATARTAGFFSQWNATLARLQRLSALNVLYMQLSGQGASTNLDPSQKLVAGGRYTVRSYDMSALAGDTGIQGTLELRHVIAAAWHGQWQALAFFDVEHVTINKQVWTPGKNDATLRGTGAGITWAGASQWSARAYVAVRLGAPPSLLENASAIRGWLEVSKGF